MHQLRRVAPAVALRLVHPLRLFVRRRKRLADAMTRVLSRFPFLDDIITALLIGDVQQRYERWVTEYDTLGEDDLQAIRKASAHLPSRPHLTVFVIGQDLPIGQTRVLDALEGQVYDNWDLRRVDDVAGMRTALRDVTSDFVVVVDSRAIVRPHALFVVADVLNHQPDVNVVYGDEDVLDSGGGRSDHYFKPDWNEALLWSQNYVGGFVAIRRALLASVEPRDPIGGDAIWALLLSVTAEVPTTTIHHVPLVLVHKVAEVAPATPSAREAVARELERRMAERGLSADVEPAGKFSYQQRPRTAQVLPRVSVVVPTTCDVGMLRPCLDGVLRRTDYPDLELLVVVNGTRVERREQREYLATVTDDPRARVLYDDDRPYNFSKVNNRAVAQATGDVICFLNDDTEVIRSGWLAAMVARVAQDHVAAVGAKLLFPNGRIQHAGVILGVGHVAGHNYARKRRRTLGYRDRAVIDQDVSCVTAACMVVRTDIFLGLGGFDETLAVAYNDIDFCLRLRRDGWRIVWTPEAELYHRESASIGRHDAAEREADWTYELNEMHRRWGSILSRDPHYNPNLSLDAPQLWQPAFPPRVAYPWRERERARHIGAAAPSGAAR